MKFNLDGPILLVGAGKMGGALLQGWLGLGLDPALVKIQDPAPQPDIVEYLISHGLVCEAMPELKQFAEVIVLAVKPQVMNSVLPSIVKFIDDGTLVVSIAAGKTIQNLSDVIGQCAIIRAMPNTPASIGRGITAAVANSIVNDEQKQICDALLRVSGDVVWIEDEHMMDAVTAVSGSGPAYVFLLAECLENAAREIGLPPELASQLARVTVSGAGELLHRSVLDAAVLRDNVTSPGGTTAAALEVFMKQGRMQNLVNEAVSAAARRSKELSS